MTMADEQQSKGQLSATQFLLIVAGLTLLAAVVGFLSGQQIVSTADAPPRAETTQAAGYLGERQRMERSKLRPLAPIVTNLADKPVVWIRLETSLVFEEIPADVEALSARISEDIVAFLRTISVKQIEGGAGFQHLSEDLNERVRARSGGLASELIIQGLIVE